MTSYSNELAAFDFETPQDLEHLLGWVVDRMERGLVQVSHPRYFGLFNPTPTYPAECADRIAAAFNPQLATATTSPFAVAVESHVTDALCRRIGFAEGSTGHFTSGGSEANYTSLICALTRADPRFASQGARVFCGAPRIYVSQEAHLAWFKIAHQAGIGRDAIRLVAADSEGRLSASALEVALLQDLQLGYVPVMIVATAGTTGAGMVDPLHACSDIAAKYGTWLHVDAAWGGAALASTRLRGWLDGIERADSVTIDAHKWFATTMGCGIFLTAHASVPREAFAVSMECMPSNDPSVDPYVTSAQWSRRFVGLRLFLALAVAGWEGYARHVERANKLAQALSARLRLDGWTQLNTSPFAVLCMAPPSDARGAKEIARAVVDSGYAWVSAVTFKGIDVVRICITSGETEESDIWALAECLNSAR